MFYKIMSLFIALCMILSFTSCKRAKNDEIGITDTDDGYSLSDTDVISNPPDTDDGTESSDQTVVNSDDTKIESEHKGSKTEEDASASGTYYDDGRIFDTSLQMAITNNSHFMYEQREEYSAVTESRFISVSDNPLSTFAADVDTAAYANVRRLLNAGNLTAAGDAARTEEMVNYFSYDYPEPNRGEPFSVTTEVFDCPWNADTSLLRIGLKTSDPDLSSRPQSNLVFLIDVSGSMETSDKLPLVKQAFLMLTENLNRDDKISIVIYASSDSIVLDGASGSEYMRIQKAIEELSAGGSTYGSKGIITAYNIAKKHFIEGGNNRVILATDGDLNVGLTSESELINLIGEEKRSGIHLSVMGFGNGNIKDNKMEALTDYGDGNYSFIDNVTEAKRVLIEEMGGTLFTVAKDVKLQLEFKPANIKAYRLIGYENRTMASEDFADDSKDGGEIGAGHRVTALYEIVDNDSEMDLGNIENKEGGDELITLSIRYKEPDGDKSELLTYHIGKNVITDKPSEDSIFAASVAQFGMLLSNSEYSNGSSYNDIIERISNLQCVKDDDYKAEFVTLVKKAAELNQN